MNMCVLVAYKDQIERSDYAPYVQGRQLVATVSKLSLEFPNSAHRRISLVPRSICKMEHPDDKNVSRMYNGNLPLWRAIFSTLHLLNVVP